MSINIGPPQVDELKPRIAVIGVGGAGGNAIANMIAAKVEGVDFIVANTDAQALNASPAERRIQLGTHITQGLGAGSRPEVGRAAAEETIAVVEEALEGAHMCFVAAGMGGGTGTGAAPVIAKAARDRGILTVGVVTKPFSFEGSRRMRSAEAGIAELQDHVDTLIIIPNQNLFLVANPNTTFKEAFTMADEVLQQGVRGITDLMVMPGLINLDFADVRSVMREMGKAMMGTGEAEGDSRALEAAQQAINNPLLDGVSMAGAKGVIWGSAFNPNLDGKIRVSVVATGIDGGAQAAPAAQPSRSFAFQPTVRPAPEPAPVFDRAVPEPVAEEAPVEEATAEPEAEASPGFSVGAPAASYDDMTGEVETAQAAEPPADDGADELVLGAPETPVEAAPPAYGSPPPTAAASGDDADLPPRPAGGGTLFERMSRLSRGTTAKSEEDGDGDDDGGVDVPRFLNRQNNQ
jgi:cell division protein FtsZ